MTQWAKATKTSMKEAHDASYTTIGGGGKEGGKSFEETVTYYQYNKPTTDNPKVKQLKAGDQVKGEYLGSFTGGKFNRMFHKIKTDKGVVSLASAGQLDKRIVKAAVGSNVIVVYDGQREIEDGQFAGRNAHAFTVRAEKLADE